MLEARSNAEKVISMTEIEFRIDACLGWRIKEVGDEGKRISVLPGDFVEPPVVDAETKGAVLLFDEKDRSTARRIGGMDEAGSEVLLDVLSECVKFQLGKGVDGSEGRNSTVLKVDLEVARAVFR